MSKNCPVSCVETISQTEECHVAAWFCEVPRSCSERITCAGKYKRHACLVARSYVTARVIYQVHLPAAMRTQTLQSL
jgi:hypothetical protein